MITNKKFINSINVEGGKIKDCITVTNITTYLWLKKSFMLWQNVEGGKVEACIIVNKNYNISMAKEVFHIMTV